MHTPGYDVTGRIGRGELWRAVDQATGETVALRRLAAHRASVAELERMASAVASLKTEHLIRLRTIVAVGDEHVLVLDHAEHGSLADLLQRRGSLTPGEVVTVIAPLASALAEAHARGLMHGRVGLRAVLIGTQGRPMLDGLGRGAIDDGPEVDGPAGDVRALVDLAQRLLGGNASPAGDQVRSALQSTTADELADRLLHACPAAPLEGLGGVVPLPISTSLGGRRALRRTGVVVKVVVVLVVVGLLGAVLVRREDTPEPDWRQIATSLDAAREKAFAAADARLLAEVYVAGSPPAVADAAAVAGLRRRGQTAAGVRHVISDVAAVRASATEVELRVLGALQTYQVQDAGGRVIARHPAGERVSDVLVLVSTPAGWRVRAVR